MRKNIKFLTHPLSGRNHSVTTRIRDVSGIGAQIFTRQPLKLPYRLALASNIPATATAAASPPMIAAPRMAS